MGNDRYLKQIALINRFSEPELAQKFIEKHGEVQHRLLIHIALYGGTSSVEYKTLKELSKFLESEKVEHIFEGDGHSLSNCWWIRLKV